MTDDHILKLWIDAWDGGLSDTWDGQQTRVIRVLRFARLLESEIRAECEQERQSMHDADNAELRADIIRGREIAAAEIGRLEEKNDVLKELVAGLRMLEGVLRGEIANLEGALRRKQACANNAK